MTEKQWLTQCVGQEVCVAVSVDGVIRNGFMTQMSIQGTLEVHPEDDDAFRVVCGARTYTYFRTEDVILMNPLTEDLATIHVAINQKETANEPRTDR